MRQAHWSVNQSTTIGFIEDEDCIKEETYILDNIL